MVRRREVLAGSAAAGLVPLLPEPAAASVSLSESAILHDIAFLEEAVSGMRKMLAVASHPAVRAGALFDLRHLCSNDQIGVHVLERRLHEEAEKDPNFKPRGYKNHLDRVEAARALHAAGYSWEDAAALVFPLSGTARAIASELELKDTNPATCRS